MSKNVRVINTINDLVGEIMKKRKFNKQSFDVTIPESATQIIAVCAICTLCLLGIFRIIQVLELGNVTNGNLYVCATIILIFVLMLVQFKTWKLSVRDDEICVNGAYRRKKCFKFEEINKVVIGKKHELKIYVDNRKITTIDRACKYYDELYELLEEKGCRIVL